MGFWRIYSYFYVACIIAGIILAVIKDNYTSDADEKKKLLISTVAMFVGPIFLLLLIGLVVGGLFGRDQI